MLIRAVDLAGAHTLSPPDPQISSGSLKPMIECIYLSCAHLAAAQGRGRDRGREREREMRERERESE